MAYTQAFIKAEKSIGWSTPSGEVIRYVDVKIETYPDIFVKSAPRGTESYWFRSGGWFNFFEGNNPRWVIPQKFKLNYYANRLYPPYGSSPTGFEIWFFDGIKLSAWAFLEQS